MDKGVASDEARAATASRPSPAVLGQAGIANAVEIDRYWMKEPCGPCPYSRSKTLPLHPERAEDFAYSAQNPYSDFVCHKTAEIYEDDEGSEYVRGARSFTCNGFLSLQVNEGARAEVGFEPHPDAFSSADEMIEHHENLWEKRHAKAMSARQGQDPQGLGAKPASAVPEGDLPKKDPNHDQR